MKRIARNEDAVNAIKAREEFHNGGHSLSAKREWPGLISQGRLSTEEFEDLKSLPGPSVYVVFSYGTPILAISDSGLVWTSRDKFSSTTSRHQNLVRRAL